MVSVEPAVLADGMMLVSLLNEMDEFYGDSESETVKQRLSQIQAYLFEDPSAPRVIVAKEADVVIGLASCSLLWPAARTSRSLYLKELYVLKAHRGRGIGRLLMDEVKRIAVELRCSRIEFTTDEENIDAQRFYESLGYRPHSGKIFFRRETT